MTITIDQFTSVEMHVGTIVEVREFPQARKPAWQLFVDFGDELGIRKSSAQITNYTAEQLQGRQIIGVTNLPPRQVGSFMSEFLTLGASDDSGSIQLLTVDHKVPNGSRIH